MYYMTTKRNSEVRAWLPCRAQTITGAKREATREFGAGFIDATLMVAGDFEHGSGDERLRVLAKKPNRPGGKWEMGPQQ